MMTRSPDRTHALALLVVLAAVAALAPEPWYETDRRQYQEIGRAVVQRDCSALHCFRPLVPALLEHLPGPSLLKWKSFAVVANAAAAFMVARLAIALGLGSAAAITALWLSGLGFGGLFTLFDPYTADPAMFLLGPVLTLWVLRGRFKAAGMLSGVGVLAKEFAAAPLWIGAGAAVLAGQWWRGARVATLAFAVTVLWAVLQLVLMIGFNNSYGGHASANLLGGGYIVVWFDELGARTALTALFTELGPMYLLAPFGFALAPPELRRLTLAAAPALLAFAYVQQPDRALWNFHFLVAPLAAIVLARAPRPLIGVFFVAFAVANLRLAAQLEFLPAARYALLLSIVIAAAAVVLVWRRRGAVHEGVASADAPGFPVGYRTLLAASAATAVLAVLVLADMALHRRTQSADGLNREGYRGEILRSKAEGEVRIAIAGGATAFSPGVAWEQSLGAVTRQFLWQRWRWTESTFVPTSIADVSHPSETAAALPATLRAYRHLDADILCLMTGHNDLPGTWISSAASRDSLLFRSVGYHSLLPAMLQRAPLVPVAPRVAVDLEWVAAQARTPMVQWAPAPCLDPWVAYCDRVASAIEESVSRGQKVLVVTEPYVSAAHVAQQQALAGMIAQRFAGDARVRYLDLGWQTDQRDAALVVEGWKLTLRGIEFYADELFTGLHAMLTQS